MDPLEEALAALEEFEQQQFEDDPMKYYTASDDPQDWIED